MAKRSDLRALKNLVDQAYLIVSSDPIPQGGIESLRENLDAARKLAGLLWEDAKESVSNEKSDAWRAKSSKKYQTVLTLGKPPSQVRSRSAFIIARRARELGMDLEAVARAINCTEQYARDLMQGTKIPLNRKVGEIIRGLVIPLP